MTRIIAGIAGSRHLVGPASPTRPTSDRIRESIFNRLENWDALSGAKVLDLYAGTGALALEAVSRGAAMAVMVEKDSKAAAVCIKNSLLIQDSLQAAKTEAETKVVNKSVENFLGMPKEVSFDLVFIDPPYEVTNAEITANLQNLRHLLADEAVVIVERSSRSGEFQTPAGFNAEDCKNYGDTNVFWFSYLVEETL